MRAVVLHAPNDLRFEEIPTPAAGPGEVVVRTRAAAICGTDLRIVDGSKTRGVRYPSVLGHELAGEIADIGPGVTGLAVGDRVAVTPIVYCRHCYYCNHGMENLCLNNRALGYDYDGGFAEYTLVPAAAVAAGNVFPLPDGVSFVEGSLAEPLACCLNGMEKSRVSIGQSNLIVGAGPIGLMHVQLAKAAGVREVVVSEPQAHRRKIARDLGATMVVNPQKADLARVVADLTDGLGVDAVIMAIGSPEAVDQALGLVRKGGTFNFFAGFAGRGNVELSANAIHYGEINVVGTSSSSRRHYGQALALVESRAVNLQTLATSVHPLAETMEAIALVRRGEGLRAIVSPQI